ncbi:DUF6148 family protein [Schinkia azotoformans]|uniref:DUF6148 family protein n=1 Tax=Schinkia azotoformans TaxID=1454 RepID=UPI002DB5571D|nr:DUF6148 family protein [Schinkia azotoformans]MEC1744130.1 DUF6148 family protein [Schinkia azotoformans]
MTNSNQELVDAQEMLKLWQDAEKKLASGIVKSYAIGSRNLTYIDLKEIIERISYWENKIKKLKTLASGRKIRRARRFIPRDL